MDVTIEVQGDNATIGLIGEVDAVASPELRATVLGALDGGVTNITFDCAELTFIDSAGLSVLVEAHQQAQLRWGHVTIKTPSTTLLRLLEITGLDQELTVERG
ncbi:MAG: STAS domain-containing protein [Acidimicrobiia bacterium]|nr:STAS domain-containing protein [Acidimicrobiia bacterium]